MVQMKYAGIGSRQTPVPIMDMMHNIAQVLGSAGVMLRSGSAIGADTAFETGAKAVNGPLETFLALNSSRQPHWFNHARRYHPVWDTLQRSAQQLHARNSAVMLGNKLDSPVDFVVCWTPGAQVQGGTGQALRIAADYKIPVFNLFEPDAVYRMWAKFAELSHNV